MEHNDEKRRQLEVAGEVLDLADAMGLPVSGITLDVQAVKVWLVDWTAGHRLACAIDGDPVPWRYPGRDVEEFWTWTGKHRDVTVIVFAREQAEEVAS